MKTRIHQERKNNKGDAATTAIIDLVESMVLAGVGKEDEDCILQNQSYVPAAWIRNGPSNGILDC